MSMGGRADSFEFVHDFSSVVEDSGRVVRWANDLGRNAIRLGVGTDEEVAATVHAANGPNPWWGVAENVITRLIDAYGERWCVILLENSTEVGFVLPGSEVHDGIARDRWTFQEKSGRHFKLQTSADLAGSYRFSSHSELLGILKVLMGWRVRR
jgi:hypothetical protein